jgi:PhnB protein
MKEHPMGRIPDGFHTITPQIVVSNGDKAIALYKKALDAKELSRFVMPSTDKIMHAALQIGTSKLFLSDAGMQKKNPRGLGSAFYIYVIDVDAAHKRALDAGMSETMAPVDMFWGDRFSAVDDRYGHRWCFATQVREVSREEMVEAAKQQWASAKPDRKSGGKKAKDKGKKDKEKSRKESKDNKSEGAKKDKKKDKKKKK